MCNKEGFCHSLLSNIIKPASGQELFISVDILKEIIEKSHSLIQEKFIERKDFQTIIKLIYKKTEKVNSKERLKIIKADPDDDKILECAAACQADLIISMDHHLLKLKTFRSAGIIHPKTFLHILGK